MVLCRCSKCVSLVGRQKCHSNFGGSDGIGARVLDVNTTFIERDVGNDSCVCRGRRAGGGHIIPPLSRVISYLSESLAT